MHLMLLNQLCFLLEFYFVCFMFCSFTLLEFVFAFTLLLHLNKLFVLLHYFCFYLRIVCFVFALVYRKLIVHLFIRVVTDTVRIYLVVMCLCFFFLRVNRASPRGGIKVYIFVYLCILFVFSPR